MQMGSWLIEKMEFSAVLAFFPVVAIRTNLSTQLLRYKETKRNEYQEI